MSGVTGPDAGGAVDAFSPGVAHHAAGVLGEWAHQRVFRNSTFRLSRCTGMVPAGARTCKGGFDASGAFARCASVRPAPDDAAFPAVG